MVESSRNEGSVTERSNTQLPAHRRNVVMGIAALALAAIVQLISGILAGLAHDWMRMSLLLFGSYLAVLFSSMTLLREDVVGLFRRLELRLGGESRPSRAMPRWVRTADIITIVAVPLLLCLAGFAGLNRRWLAFGLYLLGCGTVAVMPLVLWTHVRIRDWSRHLELTNDE